GGGGGGGRARAGDAPGESLAKEQGREAERGRRVRGLVRASAAALAASAVVMAACWMGLLGAVGADDWLERYFLKHMQQYLPPPEVRDIVVLRGAAGEPLGAPGPGWPTAPGPMV